MSIESRGTPPYTIFSNETTEIRAHPTYRDDFSSALQVIFELTDGGNDVSGDLVVTPPRIVDSSGKTVFSVGNQYDLKLLKQMDSEPWLVVKKMKKCTFRR